MRVMVDENASPGSVLDTISCSENSCGKKAPSFWTFHKFTHFLNELFIVQTDLIPLWKRTTSPLVNSYF